VLFIALTTTLKFLLGLKIMRKKPIYKPVYKPCAHCGKDFALTQKQWALDEGKFCSRQCCVDAMRVSPALTCYGCGKRYSNHNPERRQAFFAQYFCGRDCKDVFTKKALVQAGAKCE
jgi:hypothetical protein